MRLLLQDLERVSGRPVSRSLSEAAATWGNLPLPGRATYIPPVPVEHGVRFDADTATLLESLVAASREGDARAVAYIENLLWPDMTDTQRDLFKLLLDTCQGSL